MTALDELVTRVVDEVNAPHEGDGASWNRAVASRLVAELAKGQEPIAAYSDSGEVTWLKYPDNLFEGGLLYAAPVITVTEYPKWARIHSPDEQQTFYESVLPSIRTIAEVLGYAIGVHGSLRRDLDLIAVTWRDNPATPDKLALAIQHAACGISSEKVTWEQKPLGRIATSLPICWTEDARPSSGHIDLSIAPVIPAGCEDEGCPHYGTPHSHGTLPAGYVLVPVEPTEAMLEATLQR